MRKTLLFILLLLISVPLSYAQTITVNTYGVSPRQVENDSVAHYFDEWYNGLQNVGKHSKVYLEVTNTAGQLNSPVWNFISKPNGSTVTFGAVNDIDTSNQVIFFKPDTVGTYVVEVTDGTMGDTIIINSSLYAGIQNGFCNSCHNSTYNSWTGTQHSVAAKDGFNGTLSSHFNASCLQCHTTGYDDMANNQGFDDFPFVFPDSLYPGQNDSLTAEFPDAMARANVQCEACHGPGMNHFADTTNFHIAKSLSPELCGYCHDGSGAHEYYSEQYYASVHANPTTLARGSSASCAQCHSGSGFVAWIKGNKTPLTTAPPLAKIACAVCHDPHDATNSFQLRTETATLQNGVALSDIGEGALCMNCHQARVEAVSYTDDYLNNLSSHYGPHHGPQGDVIAGTNAITFGHNISSSPHMQVADGCIACHMASASVNPDGSRQLFGSHSLNMVDPRTGNDNVAACAPCHGDIGTSFSDKKYYINGNADLDGNGQADGLQIEMEGLLNKLALLLPPVGTTDVSITDSSVTLAQAQAAYNYFMVEEDRSLGIHNPAFTFGIMKASIEALGGVLAVDYDNGTTPHEFNLAQNYPNPFNPTTQINFTLAKASHVRLDVYNITGQLVKTIVDQDLSLGNHSFTFDATNLASGIYFYRITTTNFTATKKMVLLR